MIMQSQDVEQLRLLSLFHYVMAVLTGLFSMFPLIHLTFGVLIVSGSLKDPGRNKLPPEFFGWLLIVAALITISIGITMTICIVIAGRRLGKHKSYTYCLVIAGLQCLFVPIGTVLGVFTILVLQRASVKALFEGKAEPSIPSIQSHPQ